MGLAGTARTLADPTSSSARLPALRDLIGLVLDVPACYWEIHCCDRRG